MTVLFGIDRLLGEQSARGMDVKNVKLDPARVKEATAGALVSPEAEGQLPTSVATNVRVITMSSHWGLAP